MGLLNARRVLLLGLLCLSAAPRAAAEEPPVALPSRAQPRVYSLAQLLELAGRNYPKIHEARARLARKQAELREARLVPFGEFQVFGGAGVAPTVRGTTIYSPNSDAALTENMGLAWQVGVEGVVPLWTFGKLSNLWTAARASVELGESEVDKERDAIALEVRRAFYGRQLARDSLLLLEEVTSTLDEHLHRVEESGAEGDDVALLKVKMQRAELRAMQSEAIKGERSALAALRFYTGASEPLETPDEPLAPVEHVLGPLGRYLEAARLHRPELNMAKAGLVARQAQVQLERARYLPDFGLGVTAKLGRAGDITDQRNPFAYDPANVSFFGAGLVMRWKLDFLPQSARVAQAQADLEQVRAIERYALGGIAVEVEKAYAEAEDAQRRLEAWAEATRYAKQWLIKVQQGLDLGLGEDDELVEPAKEYALKRFKEMSARFDYNVALSSLALATGWDGLLGGG